MIEVSFDFETYSEADLKAVGAWVYSEHPSTKALCMAYAYGDDEPQLWLPGDQLPDFVIHPGAYIKRAWNSFFEWCIWHNTLNWTESPISTWSDPMAQAAAMSLPLGLGNCASALNLPSDQQKDKRGRYLINRLCKPCSYNLDYNALMQELYEYCLQDVVTERAVSSRLNPLSDEERQVWELDQLINIRGIHVDTQNVDRAIEVITDEVKILNEEVYHLTNGFLTDTSRIGKIKEYATSQGYELKDCTKGNLDSVIKAPDTPPKVRRVAQIRLMAGKTSTSKFDAMKRTAASDNRVHGSIQYHAASTGRWGGRLIQPQNFARPTIDDPDLAIELMQEGHAAVDLFYDNVMEAMSSSLRGMLIPSDDHRFVVCDYSAIEARVVAWLAGQEDVLDVFRGHGKIYEHTASQIYKMPVEKIGKDSKERFIGKVAALALGYGGGVKAFTGMAQMYGVVIPEDEAGKIVKDWREANDKIVAYWYAVEAAAKKAVKNPGEVFDVGNVRFGVPKSGKYLIIRLPSGRRLTYMFPFISKNERFNTEQISFYGVDSFTKKWGKQDTYSGKLVENITQAVARDIMSNAMLEVDGETYNIVLTVHDELVTEAPIGQGSLAELSELMCRLPKWAEGLPLNADGYEAVRYKK